MANGRFERIHHGVQSRKCALVLIDDVIGRHCGSCSVKLLLFKYRSVKEMRRCLIERHSEEFESWMFGRKKEKKGEVCRSTYIVFRPHRLGKKQHKCLGMPLGGPL